MLKGKVSKYGANVDTGDIIPARYLNMSDPSQGRINNLTRGLVFWAKPYPDFLLELISAGGLISYTRKRLARRT